MKNISTGTGLCVLGGFAVVALAFRAPTLDDSVTSLAARVLSLENRVERLESDRGGRSPNGTTTQPKAATEEPKWKDVVMWRQLKNGHSMSAVRALLGDPGKVFQNGESLTTWYYGYPGGGRVDFRDGYVNGWSEP